MNRRFASQRSQRVAILIALLGFLGLAILNLNLGLDAQEHSALIRLKNLGLRQLESGNYAASKLAFAEIAARLPEDRLGPQNLVVAGLLALKAGESLDQQAAFQHTRTALTQLDAVTTDHVIAAVLRARLEVLAGDPAAATQALQPLTEDGDTSASFWFELYTIARDAPNQSEIAHHALAQAAGLEPDNLAVLLEWLLVRVEHRDRGVIADLENAQSLLEPFAESIRHFANIELVSLIATALAAAENGKWTETERHVRALTNVLRPEIAVRLDRKRLLRHELDFAVTEFETTRMQRTSEAATKTGIPVRFLSIAGLPRLEAVTDTILVDLDVDGDLDIALLRPGTLETYVQNHNEWQPGPTLRVPIDVTRLIAADFDRDTGQIKGACETADLDLVLFGPGGIQIVENRQTLDQRGLHLVAPRQGLETLVDVRAANVIDVDHDGDLDLAVSSSAGVSIWINRGHWQFADISYRSALPPIEDKSTALVTVDWNRTVDLDLVVGREDSPLGFMENHRHGRLRWRELGTGFELLNRAAAVAVGDFNGNVSWDIAAAGPAGLAVVLTHCAEPGSVSAAEATRLSEQPWDGVTIWDYDNDGHKDLLAYGNAGIAVWRGSVDGHFEPIRDLFAETKKNVQAVDVGDIDTDGDLDLLVLSQGHLTVYSNDGGNKNNWLSIRLSGQQNADQKDERVNIHGAGSLLEIKAGAHYQASVVEQPVTHFGLGNTAKADVARVLWTNGIPQVVLEPESGAPICEVQELKGSCPYLYTWNGEGFEFVTDLLWASPVGLQLAEYVVAPAREWEYVKIPSDKLVDHAGIYQMRITEELWEAAYFDRVGLMTVDHPADIDIYSNEKVGPAAIAEFKIHTVANPLTPVSAHDDHGTDVLNVIANRDERYLKPFERRIVQGLGESHYLELDLGAQGHAPSIVLFLSGWIFPTDTSLNVALSQNPAIDAPRPPAIWVPDKDGGWREVVPYMGFPGGKTKTIAVDLSEVFLTDDYRVRIVTSAEIYWDHVFFTVDENPAPIVLSELSLLDAALSFRGFSKRVQDQHHGPGSFLYHEVDTTPRWPPMNGRFTRYGDVTELVTEADGQVVVMGAGDDMQLRFRAPQTPLPAGWQRDFILHSVGWDKDADLNTVYGDSSEPGPLADTEPHLYQSRHQDHIDFARLIKEFQNH